MQNKFYSLILKFAVVAFLPEMLYAAGTYYNGNYTSPQRNNYNYNMNGYGARPQQNAAYNNGAYNTTNTTYSRDTTYSRTRTGVMPNSNVYVGGNYQNYTRVTESNPQQQTRQVRKSGQSEGLSLGATLTHEFASWNFSMNSAGSELHYDNIRWNVLDAIAKYDFGTGNTPMRIEAGLKYGIQFGNSTMVDDDITNGGYLVTEWYDHDDLNHNGVVDSGEPLEYLGPQVGHSLSIGDSSGGDMFGFHAGFGLPGMFNIGSARVTPSVGFRYFKHKLETKKDHGLTVDTGTCTAVSGSDEIQCDPLVIAVNYTGTELVGGHVLWDAEKIFNEDGEWTGYWVLGSNENAVTVDGTYMFYLPSISHSYETTWMGPYLALDLEYEINANNAFNARFELGLPMYTSTGDQPYRSDWEHPKSVEDKGGFGDAWHIGLLANYMTALSDAVALSIGVTFDYYTLSGGEANTYLNSSYYTSRYNALLNYYQNTLGLTEYDMLNGYEAGGVTYGPNAEAVNIKQLESDCSGWVCKTDNEIDSIYKSMGLRVGIQARF
ncbi:MAG: hypothetical protein J5613_03365 [Alphaproteobacteria bacterium]|nr:hypothetical protein [Alphaproteobacteria bacterium]